MERQHDDNGEGTVGNRGEDILNHLVGDASVHHHGGHEARRAADAGRLEHTEPRLGLHPGGNHVGDDDRQGEEGLERQVGADHQPGQNGAQGNGAHGHTEADQQGVQQGLDEQVPAQVAGQQPLPVKKCKFTGHAARNRPQVPLGQLESRGQHVKQREDDQIGQQDDGNQDDHIVRVRNDRFDLVLQAFGLGVVLLVWFHCVKAPSLFPRFQNRKRVHGLTDFMQTFSAFWDNLIIANRELSRCVLHFSH